ncbi:MAG: hypothetical protein DRP55_04180 [Spirochaetes bacterium]|nr:MAG: hypothetical protein DRP55_04180 [Spirochaetota bacterium]
MKPEPLNLEKLTDIIVALEYPNIKQFSHLEQSAIYLYRETVKRLLREYFKSAVEGLLADIDELVDWDANYQDYVINLEDVRFLIKKWFPNIQEGENDKAKSE